jgi:hypothetical protein
MCLTFLTIFSYADDEAKCIAMRTKVEAPVKWKNLRSTQDPF